MAITVEFDFESRADEVKEELAAKKEKALYMIGLQAEGYAKTYCPVDTGRLRNSISFATSTRAVSGGGPNEPSPKASPDDYTPRGAPDEDEVVIGTNVEYAVYVELGSLGRSPVHFLERAASGHADEYKAIIESVMRE